jgi:hypothetical protein
MEKFIVLDGMQMDNLVLEILKISPHQKQLNYKQRLKIFSHHKIHVHHFFYLVNKNNEKKNK